MLNEFMEYRQYTGDPAAEKRLDAKELTEKFSGIERPLITLARRVIRTDPDGELLNEMCVIRGLRLWCGLRRKRECRVIERNGNERRWKAVPQEYFQRVTEENRAKVRDLQIRDNLCLPEQIQLEVEEGFHLTDTEEELYEAYMAQDDQKRCRECLECRKHGYDSGDAEVCRTMEDWNGWLIRYAQLRYPQGYETPEEANKGVHRIEKGIRDRRQSYDQVLFSPKVREEDYAGNNTFKKVTFQGILAKALLAGPLEQRYLVAEHVVSKDALGIRISQKNGGEKKTKCSASELDVICKETAAYLLAGGTSAGEYVVVNKTDVSNWGKSEIKNEAGRAGRLIRYFYQKDGDSPELPVFEEISFNNVSKMKICPEWMEYCGWRLATDTELDAILKEHPDCLYFRDDGGRENMTVRKRYGEET